MTKEELKLQNEKEIQDLLSQPYSTENWKIIAERVFPNVSFDSNPKVERLDNQKVEYLRQIGTVRLKDDKNLAMFEVKVAPNVNIPRNRVELRNLLAGTIDQTKHHGVLVIYEQGKEDYRFTFTSKSSEVDIETGAEEKKETDPKRFTYLLGKNQKCRTAAKRLYTIKEKKDQGKDIEIGDIVNAFNVGKLNDEFFEGYRKIYGEFTKAVTGLDENMKGSGRAMKGFNKYFPGETEKAKKEARDFIKKMMGRIVFLYFVQKKGWMGVPKNANWGEGDLDFMKRLFDATKDKNSFYSNVLVPLFYKNLNTERTDSIIDLKKGLFDDKSILETKVPYLNGGLFANDKPDTDDLIFPEEEFIFSALFEFLDKYNFTIDEDNELDHTVAVDPEMLGHIFENLLEDNKEKGAFYTPKEIVHYMCQESLTEYLFTTLKNKHSINESDLRENIAEFITKDNRRYIKGKEKYIAQALFDIKICDPAIGSGAFPIGLLSEIYESIIALKDILTVKDIWNLNGDEFDEVKIKSQIIRNSIYGVDIENGAVDIARLRFWLSLIINEVEPKPLPNLDYKIMQGNSLLESFGEIDLSVVPQKPKPGEIPFEIEGDGFTLDDVEKLKSEVDTYFNEADPKIKQKLKKDINKTIIEFIRAKVNGKKEILENEIDRLQINLQSVKGSGAETVAAKTKKEKAIAKLKIEIQIVEKRIKELLKQQSELIEMEESQSHNFFLCHLWFADVFEKGGFDIVIGNPPYITYKGKEAVNISDSEVNLLIKLYPNSAEYKVNSYALFIERGLELLKNNGTMSFIIPSTILQNEYLKNIRKHLITNFSINQILSFGNKVFKATTDSIILEVNKVKNPENITKVVRKINLNFFLNDDVKFYETSKWNNLKNDYIISIKATSLEDQLLDKIEKDSNSIDDFFEVYVGIVASGIKKFLSDTKHSSNYKKYLQGKHLDNFCIIPEKLYINFDINKLHSNTDEDVYLKKQKILVRKTGNRLIAALDENKYYTDQSIYNLYLKENTNVNIYFILGLLNSNLLEYYFNKRMITNADVYPYIKGIHLKKLPVKLPSEIEFNKFETLVKDIIENKSNNKYSISKVIKLNQWIYKLYNLDDKEILEIDKWKREGTSKVNDI